MNRRLSEFQIRATCRELVARDPNLTGRQLRRELKDRFGAVGKTERVFDLWREETRKIRIAIAAAALPADVAELQHRLRIAEATAAENLKRAELAEYRERAHQDHWALEIDRLKQQLESQGDDQAGQGASIPFRV
jgi:Plasmid replication region DNA-binding N-term